MSLYWRSFHNGRKVGLSRLLRVRYVNDCIHRMFHCHVCKRYLPVCVATLVPCASRQLFVRDFATGLVACSRHPGKRSHPGGAGWPRRFSSPEIEQQLVDRAMLTDEEGYFSTYETYSMSQTFLTTSSCSQCYCVILNLKCVVETRVYLAVFEDHLVALKVPNAERVTFEDQQHEFETVLRVSESPHPNVLGCLFGWEDAAKGLVPMVMPYAEGGSLKSRMEEDPLPGFMTNPQRMTNAVLDMLDGMDHLHSLKLTHRDPAPRNVVIAQDGRFMLCDFGLSRFMKRDADGQYGYGQKGEQGCAWAWMAPESFFTSEFNEQTDMWSLGVVIWQMLTRCPKPYDELTYDKVSYGIICGRLNLCQIERWPMPQGNCACL